MSGLARLPADWYLRYRLKLRHVQLLAALDTHRNLNKAAEALHLQQPAASRLLTELEARLGQELFERHARGMTPNLYGEVLIRRSRMILADLAGTGDELRGLARGDTGNVVIGSVDAPAVTLLVDAVKAVLAAHPQINVVLHSDASEGLLRGLLSGELDVMLGRPVGNVPPSAITYLEVGDEQLRFICRPGHALLHRGPLPLATLLKESWVMQPPGTMLRQSVQAMLRLYGQTEPAQVINTQSLMMTLAYVSRTDAIGVMSEPVALQQAACGQIELLPVDVALSVGTYGMILSRHRLLSPAARLIVAALGNALAKDDTGPQLDDAAGPASHGVRSQQASSH
jgi:DNA-binding transcriptional LysR family regulator